MLRRLFGPQEEELTVGRAILHNVKLHDLYTSLAVSGRLIQSSNRMRVEKDGQNFSQL